MDDANMRLDAGRTEVSAHADHSPHPGQRLQWLDDTRDVNDALERLGTAAGISFPPRDERESPVKRIRSPRHDVKHSFSRLFFLDHVLLRSTLEDFFAWLPVIGDEDEKLHVLATKLHCATEQRVAFSPTTGSPRVIRRSQRPLAEPNSPTMSIRHAPKTTVEDAGGIQPPPPLFQDGKISRNTSFANTSFWSKPSQESQDHLSPATSVGSFRSTHQEAEQLQDVFASSWSDVTATRVLTELADPGGLANNSANIYQHREEKAHASSGKKRLREASLFPVESVSRRLFPAAQIRVTAGLDGANDVGTQEFPASSSLQAKITQLDDSPRRQDRRSPDMHFRVRDIPENGLSQIQLPSSFLSLPLHLRLEIQRLLQTDSITPNELDNIWERPRTMDSLHEIIRRSELCASFAPSSVTSFEEHDICGKLRWSRKSSGPVFRLEMSPPQKDSSNSLQRKFGRHRFLNIELPSLNSVPTEMDLKGQSTHIRDQMYQLLGRDQHFLGCRWRLFLVQSKKKKILRDHDFKKAGAVQLMLFATSSVCAVDTLEPISIVDLVDWAVPLHENSKQTACKLYARLDLAASKTTAAYTFTPDEISYNEDDLKATDVPGDTSFNDPAFDFTEPYNKDAVMSDGQCWIHPWVMAKIRDCLKIDYLPSAVQGRIFGAKGIWYLKSSDPIPIRKPNGPLIGISNSQIKAWQKDSNFTESYDPTTLTFNALRVSHSARPSILYADFLPILVDRGTSRDSLAQCVRRISKNEVKEFTDSLESWIALLKWTHGQNKLREDSVPGAHSNTNEFPIFPSERVKYMLQSGLRPTENKFLLEEALKVADRAFEDKLKRLRVHIPRSTMLLGMADPCDCLGPNEIHVSFSAIFEDSESRQRLPHLDKLTALVARLPALRASDIQKVRVVYRAELAHLPDMVIFSAQGRRPLASKLQGGDYDGDIFWVCWQPELVEGFRNAPVPDLPDPEACGITVDRTKLSDVLGQDTDTSAPFDETKVIQWLMCQARNRMDGSLLGVLTLAHNKEVYHRNNLHAPQVVAIADAHDHLIDADKRGFGFDVQAWEKFRSMHHIAPLPEPAYRSLLGDSDDDAAERGSDKPMPRKNNVVDYMYFYVVEAAFKEGLHRARASLVATPTFDADLVSFWDNIIGPAAQGSFIHEELMSLKSKISEVVKQWTLRVTAWRAQKDSRIVQPRRLPLQWNEIIRQTRSDFKSIGPNDTNHDIAIEWLRARGHTPTTWDFLKASALMKFHHGSKIVWSVAGDELCRLKASLCGATRELSMEAYVELKPIARKRVFAETMDDEFDDADDALFDDVVAI